MKNERVLKSCSMRSLLPKDLWLEILSRLPVKSLLRFQAVSKSWRAMIKDPNFVRLHVTQFKNNRAETRLFSAKGKWECARECVVRCSKTFGIIDNFGFQSMTERFGIIENFVFQPLTDRFGFQSSSTERFGCIQDWIIIGSIDGLVLLKGPNRDLMLWNPSIQKTRDVPPSPEIHSRWRNLDTCLWFNELIKDYQCLIFAGFNEVQRHKEFGFIIGPGKLGILHSAVVYTVGTNSWKMVQLQGNYGWFYSEDRLKSIYCKGVLYFMAWDLNSDRPPCLGSFDLSTELNGSIDFPVDCDDLDPQLNDRWVLTLADAGTSLALVTLSDLEVSLWVLEESMTWTERFTFSLQIPPTLDDATFLYLKKNGDLLINLGESVVCYNSETNHQEIIQNVKSDAVLYVLHPYMESLILLS